jgi:selenocysteine-specific elongation factor
VFDYVLEQLVAGGRIVARDRLALAGHQISLTAEELRGQAILERVYREAGLAPPDLATAAASAGITPELADRLVRLLTRRNVLVRIENLFFAADALMALKAEVRALKAAGTPRVDVAGFKERYAVTRKYAIPLLEYLDRERVTRRAGESRIIL